MQIDPVREHEFYSGWQTLADLGYAQYEISNFALPGGQCQHNIDTWRMQEWIGCGPSAASQYEGFRFQRPANLDAWLEQLVTSSQLPEGAQELDAEMLTVDALIFGLRMNVGCHLPLIVSAGCRRLDAKHAALFERIRGLRLCRSRATLFK